VQARRAIVAGAGIGGLTAALALSRAGFEVDICERATALGEFGAGLQLGPNATRVLNRLGALDTVRQEAMVPDSVCALRGSDDAVLMRLPLRDAERRWGAPYLVLHRADLQRALARLVERCDGARLSLGSTALAVANGNERPVVKLAPSPTETAEASADLVIGADGLRSAVRRAIASGPGDEPVFTGRVAFRALVPSSHVDSEWTRRRVVLRLGPNAHLVHYPLRQGSVVNIVAVIQSSWRSDAPENPWDGAADRPALLRAFASWSASTRRLLASAKSWRAWPLYRRPALASYAIGRIALVGDAAHPMEPFLAQGAAQAIEDGWALGQALASERDVQQALQVYSRLRVPRATRVQREASRQARIYHMNGPMAVARDVAMRLLGPQGLSARFDWLYDAVVQPPQASRRPLANPDRPEARRS
jgi:salicylate hydroxylase